MRRYALKCRTFFLILACCGSILLSIPASAEVRNIMDEIKAEVLKELRASIPGDVRLYDLAPAGAGGLIKDNEKYKVRAVRMGRYIGRNRVNFSVSLQSGDRREQEITVTAVYDVLVDVFVTSRALRGDTLLSPDDFNVLKQRLSRLPAGAILKGDELEGKALKTNLSGGVILRSEHLASNSSAKRGRRVNVVVEGDNVFLTLKGVLKNNTAIGGTARVLCDMSKKEVSGILTDPDTVRVGI